MTHMKRMTVAFPDEIDAAIVALRKTDPFSRSSYSEVVRYLVMLGVKTDARRRRSA